MISVSISSVYNMFNLSLCLKTNYYFYIYTEIKNLFLHLIQFYLNQLFLCKGIIWLNLEL